MISSLLRRILVSAPVKLQMKSASQLKHTIRAPGTFYSTQNLPPSNAEEDTDEWEAKLSDIDKKKLFEVRVELTETYQSGARVCDPQALKPSQWKYILSLKARAARLKAFHFISRKTALKTKYKDKQQTKEIEGPKLRETIRNERQTEKHIVYSLMHVSLIPRVYNKTMDKWRNMRVWNSVRLDGPKIVFDMDYDHLMTSKLSCYTAKHLSYAIAINRENHSPFVPHLCNIKMETETMKQFQRVFPNIMSPRFPMHVEEKCFTDMFPREHLVYLTPYSPNVLGDYNADDIFVIPGVVDYGFDGQMSLAKAKKLGLRTAYFPLNRYLNWGRGRKGLPINLITNILLDFKNTHDWKVALRHVPIRKLRTMRRERHEINKPETMYGKQENYPWRPQILAHGDNEKRMDDDQQLRSTYNPCK